MIENLVHGDCMRVDLPKAQLLLTDIPYEKVNKKSNGLRKLDKEIANQGTFELVPFLNRIFPVAETFIIFCGNEQYSTIYDYFSKQKGTTRQLVYAKTNPSVMNGQRVYLSATENAVWFRKPKATFHAHCKKNIFQHGIGRNKQHPTEKNHKLLEELILDNTNAGDLILDTCMGSGSTGYVAIKNRRRFYGIELNKEYYDNAVEWLAYTDLEISNHDYFREHPDEY